MSLGVDYGLTHSCYDPLADGSPCRRMRQLPPSRGRVPGCRLLRSGDRPSCPFATRVEFACGSATASTDRPPQCGGPDPRLCCRCLVDSRDLPRSAQSARDTRRGPCPGRWSFTLKRGLDVSGGPDGDRHHPADRGRGHHDHGRGEYGPRTEPGRGAATSGSGPSRRRWRRGTCPPSPSARGWMVWSAYTRMPSSSAGPWLVSAGIPTVSPANGCSHFCHAISASRSGRPG